jgi:hypothetical protein
MNDEIRQRAIEFLRRDFGGATRAAIRYDIKCYPANWWVSHHFTWGMGIRNLLRNNGYGEKELGIDNLDDVYIPIVEEAVKND